MYKVGVEYGERLSGKVLGNQQRPRMYALRSYFFIRPRARRNQTIPSGRVTVWGYREGSELSKNLCFEMNSPKLPLQEI